MSKTPRTDAVDKDTVMRQSDGISGLWFPSYLDMLRHAQQLELELAAAEAKLRSATHTIELFCDSLDGARDGK